MVNVEFTIILEQTKAPLFMVVKIRPMVADDVIHEHDINSTVLHCEFHTSFFCVRFSFVLRSLNSVGLVPYFLLVLLSLVSFVGLTTNAKLLTTHN